MKPELEIRWAWIGWAVIAWTCIGVVAVLLVGCTYEVAQPRTPVVAPLCLFGCTITVHENDANTTQLPPEEYP